MIRRTLTWTLATLCLTAPWAVQPANAAPPAQASTLCGGSPRGCALETNDWLREGATFPVTVIGNANARVEVVVYLAIVSDGALTELRPISRDAEVITNSQGVAHTDVAVPTLDAGTESSGWALVSVGGLQDSTDMLQTVGQFVPFGARVPKVLGDGYGEEKPAGATLDLQFTGAIPGTRFAVDYADDDGVWHDTTTTDKAAPTDTAAAVARPDGITTLRYTMPRGLMSTPHKFRLRNVSDSAISPLWLATPTVDGVAEGPAAAFEPPPVGEDLSGANLVATHPQQAVMIAAGSVAGVAIIVAFAGAATGLRRRGGLR